MVKAGVNRKVAPEDDCCSRFQMMTYKVSLLSTKEGMINRVTTAILKTEWQRKKERGKSVALLTDRIEWHSSYTECLANILAE